MISIEDQIRVYVAKVAQLESPPLDDDRLAERSFIASVRLLDLVGYLEDTFTVRLRAVDLVPEKLATIGVMAAMVRERITASQR
jgi:acyl carrier protein